ncbi:alpha/beta hydrolase [Streptomyces sedi]|uniref:Alpha/beta hydrolase n=1 Tax=Streptomyces sedi TaxID=555059 RepID=A0A5C4VC52_9ACTN|nr:alpha/beta hydrolase [Streptomyces sedi]TNM33467.1 alpha/beta hydrolase [Streptomyces sedi]
MRHPSRSARRARPRPSVLVLAALTALVGLPACTPSTPTPGLSIYLEQDLDWGTCDGVATNAVDEELFANPDLECTSAEVPLDYTEPEGETAQVALMRLPARGEAEGSLLVNPGGPAGSGLSFVAAQAPTLQDGRLTERLDIVGFDPRGVGASTPSVDCYSDEEYDAGEVPRFAAVWNVTSADQAEELATRCAEGSGGAENLVSVGSTNVVKDMDVLREVLGDDELTYLGYSYGSELGAMYATEYPDNIRALVLDGGVAPDLTLPDFRVSQLAVQQDRFDDLAALCAESGDCVLGDDPRTASDRLHEIVQPVVESPAATDDGRELDVWDVYAGIVGGLFSEAKWPDVISALTALEDGDPEGVLALRDASFGRTPDGVYTIDADVNIAVRCMDYPRSTPQEHAAHARELAEVAPMFDLEVLTGQNFRSECGAWPAPPTREDPWLTDVPELPETLVVSVTGDPGTTHDGGVALAEALGSSLLTVEGKQHGAYLLGGSRCVDEIVEAYLIDVRTPPDGARCSL